MKQTELEEQVNALVEAARNHSYLFLGEDALDLPEDESLVPLHDRIKAVTAYFESLM